ncbi:MAG: peptidoglycan bridge formation glycyltransferase FemA/FemB family protein [Chloroflexota bacterium]
MTEGAPAGFMDAVLVAVAEDLAARGAVSLFVRVHPILDQDLAGPDGALLRHGVTAAVDLRLSDEELWARTRKDHRRQIKRAREHGLAATFADISELDRFADLYRGTMLRVGAADLYHFTERYFARLHEALGERFNLVFVRDPAGHVLSAGLFTETDGIVQAHLSATDHAFGPDTAAATKLMDHTVRGWAKERGNRWLHLGGGRGAREDSLLHYKLGFATHQLPYSTIRLVLDQVAYDELVQAMDPTADAHHLEGFFPLYRAGDGALRPAFLQESRERD